MEGRKKMLLVAGSGAMARMGKSYFFSDRNTAVRGAEVHSLPLNFPLKKKQDMDCRHMEILEANCFISAVER